MRETAGAKKIQKGNFVSTKCQVREPKINHSVRGGTLAFDGFCNEHFAWEEAKCKVCENLITVLLLLERNMS
jgi:hypothetical protein